MPDEIDDLIDALLGEMDRTAGHEFSYGSEIRDALKAAWRETLGRWRRELRTLESRVLTLERRLRSNDVYR
jgi:hypothetical protein